MKKVKCITINTDASHHPLQKVGGYAFYIICDHFKIQKGGMFKSNPQNSVESELMAIANAVHTLSLQKELPQANLIVINCDCLTAFERIGLKKKCLIGRRVAQSLRLLRNKTGAKSEFRHVKSHSGVKDSRSWVNEWCDNEAKKWMRIQLKTN